MATKIRIGPKDYGYYYDRATEGGTWICRRGSDYSKKGEKLVMMKEGQYMVACDCSFDGDTPIPRQRVFRAEFDQGVTRAGKHYWQINKKASQEVQDMHAPEEWMEPSKFQTTVFEEYETVE